MKYFIPYLLLIITSVSIMIYCETNMNRLSGTMSDQTKSKDFEKIDSYDHISTFAARILIVSVVSCLVLLVLLKIGWLSSHKKLFIVINIIVIIAIACLACFDGPVKRFFEMFHW